MRSSASSSEFRPDIEGLRALAVSGVVAFHFGLSGLPGGFVGVDIFFVISGYLITRHLQQEIARSGTVNLWRFYARRARRLLPASLFVILTTLIVGYFILAPSEQQFYSKGSLFASAYMINLWLIRWTVDYFATDASNNPFIHFWSLSVEEQFYLVWPALLLLLAKFRPGRGGLFVLLAIIAAVSFAFCWRMTAISQPWAFYFSPFRAWEFALGGLASMALPQEWARRFRFSPILGWIGLLLIAIAYLTVTEEVPFPGSIALLPVIGTAMVLLSGAHQSGAGPKSLLALRPLQEIGKLSYSLYLWHWPVIVYAGILKPELTIADRLLCGAATLALSVFSYRFIENPVRQNGWLAAKTSRSLALAVLLTGAGTTLAYGSAALASRSLDTEQRQVLRSAERQSAARSFDTDCVLDREEVKPKACSFGAADPKKTIVLFGDSHADHWSTPLKKIAEAKGWRLVTYMKSSCPTASVPVWNGVLMRSYEECDEFKERAFREIASLKPDMVILSQYSSSYVENEINHASNPIALKDWTAGLRRTIERLEADGSEVVLLRDVPVHKAYLDKCVARALWQERSPSVCDTPRAEAVEETVPAAERAVAAALNAEYVDLIDLFCNETVCPAVIGGKLTFRDRHHIATAYAESLAPRVQRAVFGGDTLGWVRQPAVGR
ncbi:acyltransferase family protein [Sinorhizobium alkalisoli]|uniref:acyltransferase family protein n=1 Tax=Sinorhizobium alkalisoli TaxID=1752398 RepID=UPI00124D7BCD|nr:acyltransferase family protein [Sinorhizobium alkalisoli]MCA1491779.1 acyltransferase [Ensifer sp. NBAIM29]QFI66916.1 O-antigen acetylase [Sinorhizobium alkalisoli]